MHYFAEIKKEGDIYYVTFPDLENVQTYAHNFTDAVEYAEEALNGCIEADFERGFSLPEAKEYKGEGYYPIQVYPHIAIALNLRKIRAGKSQKEIADMLGISYQAYQKLENPRKCNPTLKTLEKIAKVLNKELEVCLG